MTLLFWRYLRMPSRILLSTPLALLAVVLVFAPPRIRAEPPSGVSEVVPDPTGGAVANKGDSHARQEKTGAVGVYKFYLLPGEVYCNRLQDCRHRVGHHRRHPDCRSQPGPDPRSGSGNSALAASDALTWHGITLYGAYDIGVGWVSHGLPENGYNYEGASLVNRNGYEHRFLIAPNNLQQTGLGVRGKEEFQPGWSVVFNANTGINPQSGLLANASATQTINNGLPRRSYSYAIDGARAGQPFNDEIYGGVSSDAFRHADLRSSALSRYRCDAPLRSGRRRLCLFVHRV